MVEIIVYLPHGKNVTHSPISQYHGADVRPYDTKSPGIKRHGFDIILLR